MYRRYRKLIKDGMGMRDALYLMYAERGIERSEVDEIFSPVGMPPALPGHDHLYREIRDGKEVIGWELRS